VNNNDENIAMFTMISEPNTKMKSSDIEIIAERENQRMDLPLFVSCHSFFSVWIYAGLCLSFDGNFIFC
jgi:hypothetical protein